MFHFNGNAWNPVELEETRGGSTINTPYHLEDVYGFSSNDIWAVGNHRELIYTDSTREKKLSSLVIHYNGVEWVESDTIPDKEIMSLGGRSGDDFWVGGLNGILYHYNGSSFEFFPHPLVINPEWFHYINDIVSDADGNAYALLQVPGGGSITPIVYLLKFEVGEWRVFDSAPNDNWTRLWMSPSNTLYAVGANHVDRWDGGVRTTMLDSTIFYSVFGTDDNDFFVAGRNSPHDFQAAVWHFNGSEFRRLNIPKLDGAVTGGIWTDGDEVFIVTSLIDSSPQTSAVLHGH